MAYELSEINRRVKTDPAAFLQECDAAYTANVERAALRIAENVRQRSPIVLLSGPSGSGKTTTAMKIQEELLRLGVRSHTVSMDNYFRTLDKKTAPRTPEGDIDFESPLIMDMPLLNEHFDQLSQGEEIQIPHFEFARQMRNDARATPLLLGKNEVAIFEGIHALNDEISARHPEATKVYISARSDVEDNDDVIFKRTWLRLVRRTVRDFNFRGSDAAETLAMWATVRRGEKLYISPFKHRADILFDSSLAYEVSVMKHYALPLLQAIPQENPRKAELLSLVDAFEQFEPLDAGLVAPESLLREFIGGGTYKYH